MNAIMRRPNTRAPLAPREPVPIDVAQLEARILGRLAGMHWYTLIVDPQSWKRVAERAGELGYATYTPMLREQVKGTPRHPVSRVVERPALGGYLFVDMPGPERRFDLFIPEATDAVQGIRGCRGFITLDGSPVALHEAVIEDMWAREKRGEFDLTGLSEDGRFIIPKWVKSGAWVELVGGPFASFPGHIEEVSSSKLIVVGVHIFGRVTPVTVPLEWIRLARSEDHGILISRKNRAKRPASVPRNGTAY